MSESRAARGDRSVVEYIRAARAPELPVVLLEDLVPSWGWCSRCSASA